MLGLSDDFGIEALPEWFGKMSYVQTLLLFILNWSTVAMKLKLKC